MMKLIKSIKAHCDVPCGIYETDSLKSAAQTCLKLTKAALELRQKAEETDQAANQWVRLIMHKEEHAQICKQQVYILWSDYFKKDHFDKYSDLSETLWLTAKQCTAVKQNVDEEAVLQLIDLIAIIDRIFQETQTDK